MPAVPTEQQAGDQHGDLDRCAHDPDPPAGPARQHQHHRIPRTRAQARSDVEGRSAEQQDPGRDEADPHEQRRPRQRVHPRYGDQDVDRGADHDRVGDRAEPRRHTGGIHDTATITSPTTMAAVPSESGVCSEIPWCSTSHRGGAPVRIRASETDRHRDDHEAGEQHHHAGSPRGPRNSGASFIGGFFPATGVIERDYASRAPRLHCGPARQGEPWPRLSRSRDSRTSSGPLGVWACRSSRWGSTSSTGTTR